jgi:isocitrate dehydrogenase
MTYTPADGSAPVEMGGFDFPATAAWRWGMHNTRASIEGFARACSTTA